MPLGHGDESLVEGWPCRAIVCKARYIPNKKNCWFDSSYICIYIYIHVCVPELCMHACMHGWMTCL